MDKLFEIGAVECVDKIDIENTQIVFHGINKSGSYAMAMAMRDAYHLANRSNEYYAHYFLREELKTYINKIDHWVGPGFHVAHSLYGALKPRSNRIWLTLIRHPLPRILSCYNWMRLKSIKRNDLTFPTLDDWLVNTKGIAHSLIAQFGAGFGKHAKSLGRNLSNRNLFEISMDAINRDVFQYGIAEYFEESIFMFSSICGLSRIKPWIRDQRNPGRLLSNEVSEKSKSLIEELFFYDFELYNQLLSDFHYKCKEYQFGPQLDIYKKFCFEQYNDRIIQNGS